MNEWVILIPSLFLVTFLLTILDLYPLTRSFWFLTTPPYYILLVALFVLNLLAAYILRKQFFRDGDLIYVLVLASLSTFAVIQSFILKFGKIKVINLLELIDDFKVTVIYNAGKKRSKREIQRTQTIAKELSSKNIEIKELQTELYLLLSQNRNPGQTQLLISGIINQAQQTGLNLKRLLADRIAQMDLDRAEMLAKDC
jgi:hypothetical protein